MDRPEMWMGKTIDEIVDFRFRLVRGKYRIDATDFRKSGRIVDNVQELALTERPVDVEASFSQKPRGRIVLDDEIQPFGPSARMETMSVGNGRFERNLEKGFYDTDMKAADAVVQAYRNGTRLCVSDRDFSRALFFTAFSVYEKKFAHACQSVLADVYAQCDDFRRLGTAALELCCLAGGQGELYFEMRLFPWDWAAAAVILREAGGVIGTIDGETLRHDRPSLVLAANSEENFSKLKTIVEKHVPRLPY